MHDALEIRRPHPDWEQALAEFFRELETSGVSDQFHPHPLTAQFAHRIATYEGLDIFYILIERNRVLGYGMLRGWDEGYDVPSLGLALASDICGSGIGETFARFLHHAAVRRGASRIRLRVYPDNEQAIRLYRKLGYQFSDRLEAGQLVGYVELTRRKAGLDTLRREN